MPADEARVELYYDGRCGMCRRFRDLVHRLDLRDRVRSEPLQDAHARGDHLGLPDDRFWTQFHVRLPDGEVASGADALAPLLARLPPTLPLGWSLHHVPGAHRLAAALYRLALERHGGPARPWDDGEADADPTAGAGPGGDAGDAGDA